MRSRLLRYASRFSIIEPLVPASIGGSASNSSGTAMEVKIAHTVERDRFTLPTSARACEAAAPPNAARRIQPSMRYCALASVRTSDHSELPLCERPGCRSRVVLRDGGTAERARRGDVSAGAEVERVRPYIGAAPVSAALAMNISLRPSNDSDRPRNGWSPMLCLPLLLLGGI